MTRRTLLPLLVVSTLAIACQKDRPANVAAMHIIKGPCVVANANVTVTFHGVICHVLQGGAPRAVAVNSFPKATYPHIASLTAPGSIDTAALNRLGFTTAPQGGGRVKISGIDGYDIRVIGYDAATKTVIPMTPSLDSSQSSFTDLVPSLKAVSNNTMATLKKTVYADFPDKVDFSVFWELEGGSLTAVKYCAPTKFMADYQNKGMRDFAEIVTLCGIASPAPALQFRNSKDWIVPPVTFASPTFPIDMVLDNSAVGETVPQSHFFLFSRLNDGGVPTNWDDIEPISCPKKGSIPGCSDTTWP